MKNILGVAALLITLFVFGKDVMALPWTGTVKIGGTDYNGVTLFDWDKTTATFATDIIGLNNAQLTSLESYGSFTNVMLNLSLNKQTAAADSFFDIYLDNTSVVHGTLSESQSLIDTISQFYSLTGTVDTFDHSVFSPDIYGFSMQGSLDVDGKIADGYSNFTAVPEPSTIVFSGLGFLFLLAGYRNKKN